MAPDADPETTTEDGTANKDDTPAEAEHFKPVGTIFLLACFVLVLILLWTSVYLILIDRGVTV